jgi:hypothetical protein
MPQRALANPPYDPAASYIIAKAHKPPGTLRTKWVMSAVDRIQPDISAMAVNVTCLSVHGTASVDVTNPSGMASRVGLHGHRRVRKGRGRRASLSPAV